MPTPCRRNRRLVLSLLCLVWIPKAEELSADYVPPPATTWETQIIREHTTGSCLALDSPGLVSDLAAEGFISDGETERWIVDGAEWVTLSFHRDVAVLVEVPVPPGALATLALYSASSYTAEAEDALTAPPDATETVAAATVVLDELGNPASSEPSVPSVPDAEDTLDSAWSAGDPVFPPPETVIQVVATALTDAGGSTATELTAGSAEAAGQAEVAAGQGDEAASSRDAAAESFAAPEAALSAAAQVTFAMAMGSYALVVAAQASAVRAADTASTMTGGDPVRLATGEFVTTDTDLSVSAMPAVALRRSYGSASTVRGRMGAGWAWSLDERVLLGASTDTTTQVVELLAAEARAAALVGELEGTYATIVREATLAQHAYQSATSRVAEAVSLATRSSTLAGAALQYAEDALRAARRAIADIDGASGLASRAATDAVTMVVELAELLSHLSQALDKAVTALPPARDGVAAATYALGQARAAGDAPLVERALVLLDSANALLSGAQGVTLSVPGLSDQAAALQGRATAVSQGAAALLAALPARRGTAVASEAAAVGQRDTVIIPVRQAALLQLGALDGAPAAFEALYQAARSFVEQGVGQYAARLEAARGSLEAIRTARIQAQHESAYTMAALAGDHRGSLGVGEPALQATGVGTAVYVDAAGVTHLYHLLTPPDWSPARTLADGRPNYYPEGSRTRGARVADPGLLLDGEGGFAVTERDGTVRRFDLSGRLTEVADLNGNATRVEYDDAGDPAALRDPWDRRYAIQTLGGLVTALLMPDGTSIAYGYDAQGRLASVTDEAGDQVRYEYESTRLTAILKPDGSRRQYRYAELEGRWVAVSTVDEEGAQELFAYDPAAHAATYTSPSGQATRHCFDDRLRETRTEHADGSVVTMRYDEEGNLLERVDELGRAWGWSYDADGRTISATEPQGATERWGYVAHDRVAWYQDALGRLTSYDYDWRGNLVLVVGPDGSRRSLGYDERGRLIWSADEAGNRTEQGFDASGDPVWRRGPEGEVERFEYDARGRLTRSVDGVGVERSFTYTADGRTASVSVAGVPRATYAYSNRKDRASVRDALGNVTTFGYDRRHLLTEVKNAAGESVRYEYGADGKMVGKRVGEAASWEYRYDSRGRLAARVQRETGLEWGYAYDAAGQLLEERDPDGRSTGYRYDARGRLVSVIHPDGGQSGYAYDAVGNLVRETDEAGGQWRYEYDARNLPLLLIDPLGGTTRWTHDARGLMTQSEDAIGGVSRIGYDRSGQVIWSTDATGARREQGYDAAGQVTWTRDATGGLWAYAYTGLGATEAVTDPLGATTTLRYDPAGNLLAVVDALGNERTLEYDAANRLVAETDACGSRREYRYHPLGGVEEVVDPLGGRWVTEYDAVGRAVASADPLGNRQSWEYDGRGDVLAGVDALGARREYAYDPRGRRVADRDTAGNETTWGYEARGLTDWMLDPNGNKTRWEYDAAGRVVRERSALGLIETRRYDAVGNLLERVDFSGRSTNDQSDPAGRLVRRQLADGEVRTYAYDPEGRLVRAAANGVESTYGYDLAGQLVECRDGFTGERTVYAYDAVGNRVSEVCTAPDGQARSTLYEYDAVGRVVAVVDAAGRRTGLRYDAAGQEIERGLAGDLVEERRYDAAGRLTGVRTARRTGYFAEVQSAEGYVYDAAGRRTFSVDHAGAVTAYRYDAAGRIAEVLSPLEGEVVRHGLEQLERAGLFPPGSSPDRATPRAGASERAGTWTPRPEEAEAILTAYEGLVPERKWSRQATQAMWTDRYAYDAGGNRVLLANGWGAVESRYGAGNRLETVGERRYVHDASGNVVQESVAGQTVSYRYTGDDRVAAVSRAGRDAAEVRYGYDALGRRVSREAWTPAGAAKGEGAVVAARTSYGYDGLSLVRRDEVEARVLDSGLAKEAREGGDRYRALGSGGAATVGTVGTVGTTRREHVVVGGRILATVAAGAYRAYATDALGSTRETVDERGAVTERFRYDAYGDLLTRPAGGSELVAYTGKPLDVVTGQYDYGRRDYAPAVGRFTTVDPVRDGPNWYAYVNNDPVNWRDPWGLMPAAVTGAGGAPAAVLARLAAAIQNQPVKLQWPTTGTVTSEYGSREPVTYVDSEGNVRQTDPMHRGIDIANAEGTPIRASGPGTVVVAGSATTSSFGNFVILEHATGYRTLYAHLSAIDVAPGEAVASGELVGRMGRSGGDWGAHLHFEVRAPGGSDLNPRRLIAGEPKVPTAMIATGDALEAALKNR